MALYTQVDPENFVLPDATMPKNGRGAWTRKGIDFDYRYAMNPPDTARIGTVAQRSLDHWAVAAGCHAIQRRLTSLGFLTPLSDGEVGMFGPKTKAAVVSFQRKNQDPDGGAQLTDDGVVGRSDARALFTPVINQFEAEESIPDRLLRGEVNHESALDPGAIGYFIYYGDAQEYRGVDRGMCQINSLFNQQVTWKNAYHPGFAIKWSAQRLRNHYDTYRMDYPGRPNGVYWDAAVCAHNNPSAARAWVRAGAPPTEAALKYVDSVKAAIY